MRYAACKDCKFYKYDARYHHCKFHEAGPYSDPCEKFDVKRLLKPAFKYYKGLPCIDEYIHVLLDHTDKVLETFK